MYIYNGMCFAVDCIQLSRRCPAFIAGKLTVRLIRKKVQKMRWVEIIGVRLSPSPKNKLVRKIFSDFRQTIAASVAAGAEEKVAAIVYRNAFVETDLTIHLYRNTANRLPEKTRLGLTLAEILRDFGLVDHMIWIKEEK
ncbi:MAG: hypothetical protein JRE28_06060 [Deltaproteobacteria bacterium]|nr:hypothetical protein [Deltaproteobacteria bacterium]